MDMDDDAVTGDLKPEHRFDGRLFVAVTTTGIYCRPFCPAPTPKRQNVRFFPTAAASTGAGFRPCLRAAEPRPNWQFWRGSSNTVSRALGLIEAGALDDASVETLRPVAWASVNCAGCSNNISGLAISIAQTRRSAGQATHSGHQIADDRSGRRRVSAASAVHETFRQLYDGHQKHSGAPVWWTSPLHHRAVRSTGFRPPYDWTPFWLPAGPRHPGVESVSDDRYAEQIGWRRPGVVVVQPGEKNCLKQPFRVANFTHLAGNHRPHSPVFDLAADPVAIGAHLSQDTALAPYVAARRVCGCPALDDLNSRCAPFSAANHRFGGDPAGRQLVARFGEKITTFDPG